MPSRKRATPINLASAIRKSGGNSLSGAGAVSQRPFRDRVLHLLALRPYRKAELLLRLQKDGLAQADKDALDSLLQQVCAAQPVWHASPAGRPGLALGAVCVGVRAVEPPPGPPAFPVELPGEQVPLHSPGSRAAGSASKPSLDPPSPHSPMPLERTGGGGRLPLPCQQQTAPPAPSVPRVCAQRGGPSPHRWPT